MSQEAGATPEARIASRLPTVEVKKQITSFRRDQAQLGPSPTFTISAAHVSTEQIIVAKATSTIVLVAAPILVGRFSDDRPITTAPIPRCSRSLNL